MTRRHGHGVAAAILAAATGLLILTPAPAANAQSFELLLAKADPAPQLERVMGPYLQRCGETGSLQDIQCRAIRTRMQHRVTQGLFWTTVDALRVDAYDNTRLNFPVAVQSCLTCQGPMNLDENLYGNQKFYVTGAVPQSLTKTAEGIRFTGIDLKTLRVPVGPAQVERWMRATRPNLKVQFVFRTEGKRWKRGRQAGLLVKVLAYRLYNQCDGKVVTSMPPSAKPGPIDKNARCSAGPAVVARVAPRPKGLPERLNSLMIKDAMARVSSLIHACYAQYNVPGLAKTVVTVRNDGVVLDVKLRGKFKNSPTTGECIKKAIKRARFQRFRTPTMTFQYPWFLR